MGSKALLLFGLAFAIVLLISSEVSARDVADSSNNEVAKEINGVEEGKDGGGGYNHGGGHGGYNHGGGYNNGGGHHGGGGGGGCHHGQCCHGRGGCRCCYSAAEAAAQQTQAQPQN